MTKKSKTPAQVLKGLPRKAAREVIDAEMDHLDGYPGYGEPSEPTTPEQVLASASVGTILAIATVNATLPSRVIARIQTSPSLALVVGVPGADWVSPIAHALTSFRAWTEVLKRDGSKKVSDKPSVGGDTVSTALGAGRSVLGVSTAPDRYLPAALITAADLRVDIGAPNARAIRATIRLVTGRRGGAIPVDIVRGLSFDEITACLRKGSTPRDCLRRLKAASFSKCSAASDMTDVPLLQDAVGYGAAQDHGLSLIEAVEAYRRGERSWSSIEGRNIVLAGPPGTGKTTYARSLAKSLGVKLTATSVSTWFAQTAGYLNDICRKVDEVFLEASLNGGVLLVDELDSLPSRENCDSRHRDYWVTVVNHVLTTLDGAVSSPASRLIIVGATNFPDRLDEALVRPGRLDRIVRIALPDQEAIAGILRQHLGEDLPGEDLMPVAAIGIGASGAEVAGWAGGARMTARAAGRGMTLPDLLGQLAPPETRSGKVLLAVARHESAHAASCELLRCGEVLSVSLVQRGRFAGRTQTRLENSEAMTADQIDALAVATLAGRAADEHWDKATSASAGSPGSDLSVATGLIAGKHGSLGLGGTLAFRGDHAEAVELLQRDRVFLDTVQSDLDRLYALAVHFVRTHADLIDTMAHRLLARRVLGGDEVRAIIAEGPGRTFAKNGNTDLGGIHG